MGLGCAVRWLMGVGWIARVCGAKLWRRDDGRLGMWRQGWDCKCPYDVLGCEDDGDGIKSLSPFFDALIKSGLVIVPHDLISGWGSIPIFSSSPPHCSPHFLHS